MQNHLPLFKLQIDLENKADGMDFISLVDYPAHGKMHQAFSKRTPEKVEFKNHFNDDKRIITGVAIATNLPIYRVDKSGFEYNAIFTKNDTLLIAQQLFKNGYMHNVNEQHDMNKKISDIYLFESFFINDEKSNIPKAFKDQNLQPGTWITSYKVENNDVWNKIKDGEFAGFSIEGWFKEVEVKKKSNKNKMKRKSLKEILFGKQTATKPMFDSDNKDKYATATDVDGNVLVWEGEMAEGTAIFVEVEGEDPILAAAGDYTVDTDGVMTVISVDEAGIITAVEVVEADDSEEIVEEVAEAMKAMRSEHKSQLSAQKIAFDDQLSKVAESVDAISAEFAEYKEQIEKAFEEMGKKPKSKNQSTSGFLATKTK